MATPTSTTPTTVNVTTQKLDTTAEYQALVDGINADLAGIDPFVLGDTNVPRATLVATFTNVVTTANATKAARLQLATLVAAEQAALATAQPYRKSMKQYLLARLGENNPKLQTYGYTPNRVPKKSAAAKASGVVKAQATRTARGTKGKQQKAEITASAPAAAPAPAPAPAPALASALAPALPPGPTHSGS
jgi:hypothetical protein